MSSLPGGGANRPLSPHLQVWRFHITMTGSILHRVSGAGLYVGALILAGWALSLASGPEAYSTCMAILGSFPGKIVLFLLTLGLFYHLAKGIQHLIWDTGRGFSLPSANAGSIACIVVAVVASVAVWFFAAMTGAY
jgi:succinate dehydrogenase / fumarate reductase cytochrome b subunit